jgi:hypothetical protein
VEQERKAIHQEADNLREVVEAAINSLSQALVPEASGRLQVPQRTMEAMLNE